MRIIILGSGSQGAIELYFLKYLKENLGEKNVKLIDVQGFFNAYYYKNTLNKIKFRLHASFIYSSINKRIELEVNNFAPNVILVFKGLELFPNTLKKFKNNKIKIINYNPDNPFIFSGRGSGNRNVTNSISLYDAYLTYDKSIRCDLIKKHNIYSDIIPFGFEIDDFIKNTRNDLFEILRVCFIGNPDKFRAKFILEISKELPITVYGKNWKKFLKGSSVEIYDSVSGLEFWKTLYKYRVQLNLMRIHNLNSHNMRTFEITGIGGIGLMPNTPDHQLFFNDKSEVFLFENVKDCIMHAKKILSFNKHEADKIRELAEKRTGISKYSYKDRTDLLLEILNKIFI